MTTRAGAEPGGAGQRVGLEGDHPVPQLAIAIASGSDSPCCSSRDSRSCRWHVWGNAAICAARASASARVVPEGTTRFANQMSNASAAVTGRPVRTRSIARLVPISRGSWTVPPSIKGTPQRRQNTPSTASSSTTRRSHHRGCLDRYRSTTGRPGAERPPSPNNTATAASSPSSNARNVSASANASACAVGPVLRLTALRFFGCESTTVVTGPDFSTRATGGPLLSIRDDPRSPSGREASPIPRIGA